jgi:hypothetical protein
MAATWGGSAAGELFNSFVYYQDTDLTAKGIIIIDQTGLPSKAEHGRLDETAVSSESPYWVGKNGIGIAREWFEGEFGITFTEENRMMNVSIVRKKQ